MPSAGSKGAEWLLEEWVSRFGGGFEAMAGEALPHRILPPPASPPSEPLTWRQPFDIATGAWVEVTVSAAAWRLIGGKILAAAGIEEASDEDSKPTYMEVLQQALSGLASALSAEAGREVGCGKGVEGAPGAPLAGAVEWTIGDQKVVATFAVSPALIEALKPAPPAPPPPPAAAATVPAAAAPPASPALDLIYDVELPVSVSFGRAHLPIKEVLKLTSGSIVELNRAIAEPVEIIVNNCVIARGEVVVVEGNYGVRILEIVSRSERLRTLH